MGVWRGMGVCRGVCFSTTPCTCPCATRCRFPRSGPVNMHCVRCDVHRACVYMRSVGCDMHADMRSFGCDVHVVFLRFVGCGVQARVTVRLSTMWDAMENMTGASLSSRALWMQCPVLSWRVLVSIFLCARYDVSGTDSAYGGICLRTRYAMSGTDLVSAPLSVYTHAMRCP
eukprot:3509571-Rhodomonas_salina.1